MTKTFSKVLAVILSLCVLFAVPVCAGAEDDAFAISGSNFKAITYIWKDDYIGKLKMTVTGGMDAVVSEDVLVSITVNDGSAFRTVRVSDAEISISGGTAEMTFHIEQYLNHADVYSFTIPAGTFKNADGKLNEEYTASITGNELLETIDADDVPVTPVEKIIQWLKGYLADETIGWLAKIVIDVLNWFITI